jgi:hypothetical protein
MFPRLLTNMILLVIVITLGIFIYVTRNDDVVDHRLTKLDANNVTQISIFHNGRDLELKKIDKHWRMLKPTNIDANDFRVGSVLNILSTNSFGSYDPAKLELSKYGLDKPKTWMLIDKLKIEFGIDNPINHSRYVLVNGKVHTISDQFYPLISSQVGTLVSPNLLPRGAEITRIKLPDQTLSKDKIGWTSTDTHLTTDAIQKLVDAWKGAQAFGVHTYQPRKSKGRIEVSIKSQDKPLIFEISDLDPWMIIARPALNVEYHFNLKYIDRLLHPGAEKAKTSSKNNPPPAPDHTLPPAAHNTATKH